MVYQEYRGWPWMGGLVGDVRNSYRREVSLSSFITTPPNSPAPRGAPDTLAQEDPNHVGPTRCCVIQTIHLGRTYSSEQEWAKWIGVPSHERVVSNELINGKVILSCASVIVMREEGKGKGIGIVSNGRRKRDSQAWVTCIAA